MKQKHLYKTQKHFKKRWGRGGRITAKKLLHCSNAPVPTYWRHPFGEKCARESQMVLLETSMPCGLAKSLALNWIYGIFSALYTSHRFHFIDGLCSHIGAQNGRHVTDSGIKNGFTSYFPFTLHEMRFVVLALLP